MKLTDQAGAAFCFRIASKDEAKGSKVGLAGRHRLAPHSSVNASGISVDVARYANAIWWKIRPQSYLARSEFAPSPINCAPICAKCSQLKTLFNKLLNILHN